MQIAFDISESDFEWIKKWAKDGTNIPVYDTLAKYIANAKVLPEENEQKTGKWIGAENKCSCCNRAIWEYHTLPFDWRPRYCPNCGAKMEG